MKKNAIAVVDFGGQYAHLIATKIRRQHVLAEILQPEDPTERFAAYRGIVFSGSPALTSRGDEPGLRPDVLALDIPILGICFGHQQLAHRYGGTIVNGGAEWGRARFFPRTDHPLFAGWEAEEQVWMSHNDSVAAVGPQFEELGYTLLEEGGAPHRFAAIGSDALRRYGVQFHPEVDDTLHGDRLLRNFVVDICGCTPSWTMDAFLEDILQRIADQAQDNSVFLLASGGVDSTVAAVLLARALGTERLRLLHIDNGLMRKNESADVCRMYAELGLGDRLTFVDASAAFLDALEGVAEPEAKRRIIGETFVRVFDEEARKLGIEDHLLGQGTIYPDTIETGATKRSDTIKTHHNRVPLIEQLIAQGRVIEPLADLYKVEVRELGEKLGIPSKWVWRHPFPGPGLGVRLLCHDGGPVPDVSPITEQAASVAAAYGLQARALPLRSVGVKADVRTYEHPVVLHGPADFDVLQEAAGRIFKQVRGVNRCLWNLGDALPQQVIPRRAFTTRQRLDALREADAAVMDVLRTSGLYRTIWQCPTVFVPVTVDGDDGELCVVRPVLSERAMTAQAAPLPAQVVDALRARLSAIPSVRLLAVDLTSKPPGTIEWE